MPLPCRKGKTAGPAWLVDLVSMKLLKMASPSEMRQRLTIQGVSFAWTHRLRKPDTNMPSRSRIIHDLRLQ